MLAILNLTGLKKFYFIPDISYDLNKECGIWYIDIKFTWFQLTVFNKEMGLHLIRHMSNYK